MSARGEALPALPGPVATVLERQIEAVATQQVLWTGELWPGQRLEWRVEERGPAAPGELAASVPWRTRLKLDLPGLGEVDARLELAGAALRLSVSAGRGDAAPALRGAEHDLQAALEAHGLHLLGFRVEAGSGGD